jgi:hypothetical protein
VKQPQLIFLAFAVSPPATLYQCTTVSTQHQTILFGFLVPDFSVRINCKFAQDTLLLYSGLCAHSFGAKLQPFELPFNISRGWYGHWFTSSLRQALALNVHLGLFSESQQ